MALVASSCARCSLRTRALTRLEVDLHGDVDHGSGGSGKMSRHRAESHWSPERALQADATRKVVLHPGNLEPKAPVYVDTQAKNLGGLANVT